MKSIRLIPIVVFAAAALFVLKGIGLVTQGGYVLVGTQSTLAQSAPVTDTTGNAPKLTEADASAADRASEALFSDTGSGPDAQTMQDAVPVSQNGADEKIELSSTKGAGSTEQAVLERLSARRAELDLLESQLNERLALVQAAEARLSEKISGLAALEARISALVEEKKGLDNAQFVGLVGMYETMKPKDAAAIFDQLSMDVLLRVATSMNPRKMAPVLAAMNTARAQELTVRMAAQEAEPSLDAPIDDFSSLPQIVGN